MHTLGGGRCPPAPLPSLLCPLCLSIAHSKVFHRSMFSSNIISQHNSQLLMHSPVSAYSQDRPYLPCSVQQPHCSHPQHNSLSMQINMHYTPTTISHCLPQTSSAHNQETQSIIIYLCKWQQMALARCRDGVKVLWCHSHLVWLVFEGSIPTCACFVFFFSENFCDFCINSHLILVGRAMGGHVILTREGNGRSCDHCDLYMIGGTLVLQQVLQTGNQNKQVIMCTYQRYANSNIANPN